MLALILHILIITKTISYPDINTIQNNAENLNIKKEIYETTIKTINNSKNKNNIHKKITSKKTNQINIKQNIISKNQLENQLIKNNLTLNNKKPIINIKLNNKLNINPVCYKIQKHKDSTTITISDKNTIYYIIDNIDNVINQTGFKCQIQTLIYLDSIKKINSTLKETYNVTKIVKNKYQLLKFEPIISNKLTKILNTTNIILAAGLWGNLTALTTISKELTKEGYTSFNIELTGGENQECTNCPNYNFNNLTKIILPKYIEIIKNKTNKTKFTYIGHSNGCRTGLYYLNQNNKTPIKNFIGIACPGEFSTKTTLIKIINQKSKQALINFKKQNKTHITFNDLKKEILNIPFEINGENKISTDLIKDYFIAMNSTKNNIGKNIKLENLLIIYGNFLITNDFIVPTSDPKEIYNNIISNKSIITFFEDHIKISNSKKTINEIKKTLNKWTTKS